MAAPDCDDTIESSLLRPPLVAVPIVLALLGAAALLAGTGRRVRRRARRLARPANEGTTAGRRSP